MIPKTPPRLTNRATIIKYLEVDLWTWMKELTLGFTKFTFNENFQSFVIENILIKAGQEIAVSNEFKNRYPGLIPIGKVIIRQQGNANVIDGLNKWTSELLYLRNPSEEDAVVSVLFFR